MKESAGEEHLSIAWEYTNEYNDRIQAMVVIPALFSQVAMPANALTSISTQVPTNVPTLATASPSRFPTTAPTSVPTNAPTPATASPSQFPTGAPSFPSWGATLETWTDIEGDTIPNLMAGTNNLANVPNQSTRLSGSVLEVPPNTINADNLGVRMSGWLVPPTTGNYKFWIAADSQGELWLSSNGNKANKEKICQVSTSVSSRQWTMYPEQESGNIPLMAGQAYYYEVRPFSLIVVMIKVKQMECKKII
jgi:hypothetical protein